MRFRIIRPFFYWGLPIFSLIIISAKEVNAQVEIRQLTRAEYLSQAVSAIEKGEVFEDSNILITDLLYANWRERYQRSEGPILVPVGKFNSFNLERKVHILKNPSIYIIAPDEEFPLRFTISRMEFESYSTEKQEIMKREFRLEIQD